MMAKKESSEDTEEPEFEDLEFNDFDDADDGETPEDLRKSIFDGNLENAKVIEGIGYLRYTQHPQVLECNYERVGLPCLTDNSKAVSWWSVLKELVGKDI